MKKEATGGQSPDNYQHGSFKRELSRDKRQRRQLPKCAFVESQCKVVSIEMRAYHEAGHALVAAAYNIPFTYVTLIPRTKRHGGHVELNLKKVLAELRKGNTKLLRALCVMLWAGQVAQFLKSPNSPIWTAMEDFRSLDRLVPRLPVRLFAYHKRSDSFRERTPAQLRAVYRKKADRARRTAMQMLLRYWPAVELLARTLQKNKTLSRENVEAVVRPVLSELDGVV